MKKITHFDKETSEYLPVEARYYLGSGIVLVVEDCESSPDIGERVNIGGNRYKVVDVTFYPELLIWEFQLNEIL